MDPYDLPTQMDCSDLIEWIGTSDFEEHFFSFLCEHEDGLPLQDLCVNGGYHESGNGEFSELEIKEETEEKIIGRVSVSFTEASPTGCRDITFTETLKGKLEFEIDIEQENLYIENSYSIYEREPDEI